MDPGPALRVGVVDSVGLKETSWLSDCAGGFLEIDFSVEGTVPRSASTCSTLLLSTLPPVLLSSTFGLEALQGETEGALLWLGSSSSEPVVGND